MENQKSLIEIAVEIMESHEGPINIYELIEKTLALKGISDEDSSLSAKLYVDITISSKFVFMGDDNWDLKSRQSLEQFDKDGSSFNSKEEYIEDEDDEEILFDDDEELDEDEDEDDEDSDDEAEDSEDEAEELDEDEDDEELEFEDEEDEEDESYDDHDVDEERYNKIMDDYEDLYED